MANGFLVLRREDWEKATPDQRDWYIYNTLQNINNRLQKLEKKTLSPKICALLGAILGGFAAAFSAWNLK